jgi:hypothetical protein
VTGQHRPVTMDHLRSRKKPTTKRVEIVLDPAVADAVNEARNRYELARIRLEGAPQNAERSDEFHEANATLGAALEGAKDDVAAFVFRNIGRRAWEELVDEHRPTEDQQRKHRKANPSAGRLTWNPESFPIAAVAASLVEPKLSLAEITELWDDEDWNDAELAALFFGALEVNQQRRVVDLS